MAIECQYDHVHLLVGDMDAAAIWFRDKLGGKIVKRIGGDRPRIDVDLGGIRMFISPQSSADNYDVPSGRRRGMDHLAFVVADVDMAVAELSKGGVVILDPPATSRPGSWAAFVQGPDNIRIELLKRD